MSKEQVIKLRLNFEDAAFVLASLEVTRDMMNMSMDKAIEDALLPVVALLKEELDKVTRMIESVRSTRQYTSDNFGYNSEHLARRRKQGADVMAMLKQHQSANVAEEKGASIIEESANVVAFNSSTDKSKE